jgi:diguanylate cyclase (GGDEF)-like protein
VNLKDSIDPLNTKSPIDTDLLDESKKKFPTRFYNDYFISEYGRLEVLRSGRYGRSFSILLVYIEGFVGLTKRLKKEALLEILRRIIKNIMEVVRNCDVVGMIQNKGIIIILPETDYIGSLITIRKLRKSIDNISFNGDLNISISFSQATFPRDANGYGELLGVAEKRIDDYKRGLYGKLDIEQKLFWENISMLLNEDYDSPGTERFDLGEDMELSSLFQERLIEMITQEIARNSQKRGILYICPGNISHDMPVGKLIDAIGETNTKVFIVSGEATKKINISDAIYLALPDNLFLDTFFILLLRDDISYAFVSKEGWGGRLSCVHTIEPYLIMGLIEKLQHDYSLQQQL